MTRRIRLTRPAEPKRPVEAPFTATLRLNDQRFEFEMPDPQLGLVSILECVRLLLEADAAGTPWLMEVAERGRAEVLRFGTAMEGMADPARIPRHRNPG